MQKSNITFIHPCNYTPLTLFLLLFFLQDVYIHIYIWYTITQRGNYKTIFSHFLLFSFPKEVIAFSSPSFFFFYFLFFLSILFLVNCFCWLFLSSGSKISCDLRCYEFWYVYSLCFLFSVYVCVYLNHLRFMFFYFLIRWLCNCLVRVIFLFSVFCFLFKEKKKKKKIFFVIWNFDKIGSINQSLNRLCC